MFICLKCHFAAIISVQLEREHGDWIIRCPQCDAHNIVSVKISGPMAISIFEIVGWKE